MKALDYILKNYQKTDDESDGTFMAALVHSLNIEELKTLQRMIIRCGRYRYYFSNDLYQEADYAQNRENESVSVLLKNFLSKDQVTRLDARYRIRDRFNQQSHVMQIKILRTFLRGSREDRNWAYPRCSKELLDDVKKVWEKYHDKECAEFVIQHFPIDFVLENIDSLYPQKNYLYLSARLFHHPSFKFDMDRLRERYGGEWSYFYILSNSKGSFEKEEVLLNLYMHVIRFINKHKSLPSSHLVRENGTAIDYGLSLRLGDISTTQFYDMPFILKSMGKKGLVDEIQTFKNWDRKVTNIYNERIENSGLEFHQYEEGTLWSLYCNVIVDCLPNEYKSLVSSYVRSIRATLPGFSDCPF